MINLTHLFCYYLKRPLCFSDRYNQYKWLTTRGVWGPNLKLVCRVFSEWRRNKNNDGQWRLNLCQVTIVFFAKLGIRETMRLNICKWLSARYVETYNITLFWITDLRTLKANFAGHTNTFFHFKCHDSDQIVHQYIYMYDIFRYLYSHYTQYRTTFELGVSPFLSVPNYYFKSR